MNFDVKDVKSWANRDDVHTLSDAGFFGNSLSEIDDEIKRYNNGEKDRLHELYQVSDNGCYCFGYAVYFADTGAFSGTNNFAFFLPLDAVKKDKPEKKYRPFKDLYEFYKFLSISPFTKKEFCNECLLKFSFTYREKILPQIVSSVVITRIDVGSDNDPCSTFINRKDLKDWFDNYEIMNSKGEWLPFGVEVKEDD